MNNFIIDTHCHLDFDKLYSQLENVLTRAKQVNVKKLISICVKIKEIEKILAIVNNHDNIYGAIGTHPNNAEEEQDISLENILNYTSHNKIVAIGETGLDYYYEYADKNIQKQSFLKHIEASQISNLPLIIHTRKADEDTAAILQEQIKKTVFPFVMHCYTSGMGLAKTALDLGGYISLSGIVTFKNAQEIQEIAKNIPLNRILIETDAPYLAPVPYRGKTNEPSFIYETAKYLANLLNLNFDEFIQITTNNALQLFKKMQ